MTDHEHSRLIVGCGYLGRRVARRWLAAGDSVCALTRSPAHAEELRQCGIGPLVGDVLDPQTLRDLPAAETVLYAVGYDRSGSASKREVYVEGLRNVLSALPRGVRRFNYVSSTSVYGQSQGERINETAVCVPQTDGGRICLDAERLLQDTRDDRLCVQVLRLSGIYGPGRLIARVDALRAHRVVPGNPDGWLNLIHVTDAAAAIVACAKRDCAGHETWLVSDDRPVRRCAYYSALARLVGAPSPKFASSEPPPTDFGKRCDNRRLREGLGVTLEFPTIDEGLPNALAG